VTANQLKESTMTAQKNPEIQMDGPFLAPHLVCAGAAKAIEFYQRAFGADELMRMPAPDGKLMHGSVSINGSMVMLVDENKEMRMLGPKALGGTAVTIHLSVDNVDAWMTRAQAAGATIIMPAADMFWGDRYGVIEDPFGHRWSIATPVRKMTHDEIQQASVSATGEGGCRG
jgi:uncharacterized glyoxalase superfamily protein PhnB